MADDDLSERQLARRKKRVAGDRSARLARELMQLAASTLDKLELDPDVHDAIVHARSITSLNARRRAERALAGDLRRIDLVELRKRLDSARTTGTADAARLHAAEQWRERLLVEGAAGIAAFPAGDPDHVLPRLIAQALRERTTGKPPGAARALFRHVFDALKAEPVVEADDDDDDD